MKATSALTATTTMLAASQGVNQSADAFAPKQTLSKTHSLQPAATSFQRISQHRSPMDSHTEKSTTALNAISGAEVTAAATLLGHAALGIGATVGAFRISEKIDAGTDNKLAQFAGEALTAVPIILTLNLLQQDLGQLQAASDPLVKYMDSWQAQDAATQAAEIAKTTLNLN